MIKVGLTGNIGSGKTVVSGIFRVLQIPVYNADARAGNHMGSPEVVIKAVKIFGNVILDDNKNLDKRKIAEIAFSEPLKLKKLNDLIHPLVIRDFNKWVREYANADYIIMESAILYETGYASIFDKIILVSAPESVRLKRVMERDRALAAQVKSRMKQQMPENEKIKKADFVITNNDKKPLIPQVLSLHKQLLSFC